GAGNPTRLALIGDLALSGGGAITLSNNPSNAIVANAWPGHRLARRRGGRGPSRHHDHRNGADDAADISDAYSCVARVDQLAVGARVGIMAPNCDTLSPC